MKFRKKPVVIEAVQFVEPHCLPRGVQVACGHRMCPLINAVPHVHTIHNNQSIQVELGDWIIGEADGVFCYPCKPDIFEATYERVD